MIDQSRGAYCLDIHVDCMDFIVPSLVGQKLNPVNENLDSLKSYVISITNSRFMDPSSVYICAGYWNSTPLLIIMAKRYGCFL